MRNFSSARVKFTAELKFRLLETAKTLFPFARVKESKLSIMLKLKISFYFLLCAKMLFAQNISPFSDKGNLTFKYFGIERIKTGGNVEIAMNNDFDFIKPFDNTLRFAPDEPPTFSSLEYTFWEKDLKSKITLNTSVGIYRNHIKGDFFPGGIKVHFGKGNSQVGASSTANLNYEIYKKIKIGGFFQFGVGPHFTQMRANNQAILPESWGIRGVGFTANSGVQLISPKFWNRLSIFGFFVYNYTYSRYNELEIETNASGGGIFSGTWFGSRIKTPTESIGLSYDFTVFDKATVSVRPF